MIGRSAGLHEQMDPPYDLLVETIRNHRDIYEAVAAGDKATAARQMAGHLDGIRGLIHATVGG